MGLLKVSCDTFLALSHGETSFMKPNLMRLVASCDTALRHTQATKFNIYSGLRFNLYPANTYIYDGLIERATRRAF